jgi:trans-aconitate methyltransferase
MDRKQHWDTVYTTKAATEVSWFQDNPALSLGLIGQSGILKTASIVDIGGGASRLVDALLSQNYSDVTVLDIAEPALAAGKARLAANALRVHWITADITQWQPTRHYALWHDRAVFHSSPILLIAMLTGVHCWPVPPAAARSSSPASHQTVRNAAAA